MIRLALPFPTREAVVEAAHSLVDYSIAIHSNDGPPTPKFYGSGLLLAAGETRFLVTAYHVIAKGENSIVLGMPKRQRIVTLVDGAPRHSVQMKFVEIGGWAQSIAHADLDLLAIELDRSAPYCKTLEREMLFLSPAQLDTSYQPIGPLVVQGFIGSPSTTAIRYTTELYREEEAVRGPVRHHDRDKQHAVHWYNEPGQVDAHGMSGGGLWSTDFSSADNGLRFRLAGITTEWDRRSGTSLSTKIGFVVTMLRELSAEARAHLPKLDSDPDPLE